MLSVPNKNLIQRLPESILAFHLSLFYPCWWLMSVVRTPGRRLLWFAIVAMETLMSRVVLMFEITFKIHYLVSLERTWKSSTWRSSQTPPVALFSLSLLDFSFLKLATLQPTALMACLISLLPSAGAACRVLGTLRFLQPSGSQSQPFGHNCHIISHFPSSFHRDVSKSIPNWQGAIILIALPRKGIKGKDLP